MVDCGTIEDEADAERWVKARAARDKRQRSSPRPCARWSSAPASTSCGCAAALERVALYAMGQPTVTADDVRQAVPAGPEAQEDFGIAKAIRSGRRAGGAARARRWRSTPARCRSCCWASCGWRPRSCRRSASGRRSRRVFRTDLALKSSGGDPRILLERWWWSCAERTPWADVSASRGAVPRRSAYASR